MNYAVDWTDDAITALTVIRTLSTDRAAVTAAQTTIDQRLASSPLGFGFVVSEGLYAIEVHPLRAQLEISDTTHVVTVVSVGELP
jgi:hypothetical protein